MKEKLHQIKLVICEESGMDKDRYVYVKKTAQSASAFLSVFDHDEYGDDREFDDLCLLLKGDLHAEIDEHNFMRSEHVQDKELFNLQFKESVDEFLKLIEGKKGALLLYYWGPQDDWNQTIISLATIDPVPLGLINENPFIREVAKASH